MSVFKWVVVKDKDEIEAFYRDIIPKIKEAARSNGYAIGVHGSLRRDLDLIAVPWIENHSNKEQLARAIHQAACGIENQSYTWERKPLGRMAVSFPVCFREWNEVNLGHVDLSVIEQAELRDVRAKLAIATDALRDARQTLNVRTCSVHPSCIYCKAESLLSDALRALGADGEGRG